ncbi:MAG: ParB/RepB/Spo0J family partition protein [Thermodesulfobacteria bacterium]|nr:ParB/RepB/Spo0J family partition protein [Thermodesulfobacteriota bacterium]
MGKKRALGRGLSELIPEFEEVESGSVEEGIKYVPIDKIVFSSLQPRKFFKEDEEFEKLVESIKQQGILQPVLLRETEPGIYECVAGERRVRAAKKAGLKEVPAIVKELDDETVLIIALIENLQRRDLNPIEEALGYKTLIEKFGYTHEEVAQKVGKDRATVSNLLRLLKLPKEIQEDLIEGRLSVGHAKAILSLNSEELQLKVRDVVVKKGLSVRETEKLVAKIQTPVKKEKEPDPDLIYLAEELSKVVGSKVEVKTRGKKTRFVFEFDSLDRAEEFIERLKKGFLS